jgi:hypothetical protein
MSAAVAVWCQVTKQAVASAVAYFQPTSTLPVVSWSRCYPGSLAAFVASLAPSSGSKLSTVGMAPLIRSPGTVLSASAASLPRCQLCHAAQHTKQHSGMHSFTRWVRPLPVLLSSGSLLYTGSSFLLFVHSSS